MSGDSALLELVTAAGLGQLGESERAVVRAAAVGEEAACRATAADGTEACGPVRAALLRWLCVDQGARALVDPRGLRVRRAAVGELLDLSAIDVPFGIELSDCVLEDVDLSDARTRTLVLDATRCRSIQADRLSVDGGVYLRRDVDLGRDFECTAGARFENACISGDLAFDGAKLGVPQGEEVALQLGGVKIEGSLYLGMGFEARGAVCLVGASVGRDLDCSGDDDVAGASLRHEAGSAIEADGCHVGGSVYLRDRFLAEGEVRLTGAVIGATLDCEAGTFRNAGGTALSFDRATIGGSVFLRYGFEALGRVRFVGAHIAGSLSARGGSFQNSGDTEGYAVWGTGSRIERDVLFDRRPIPTAFDAHAAQQPFRTDQLVTLVGARVDGIVSFQEAEFSGDAQNGFDAHDAVVGGPLVWRAVKVNVHTQVNLANAETGRLDDDLGSWPNQGHLVLDGFNYRGMSNIPAGTKNRRTWLDGRMEWLQRQPTTIYSPQPYEQLVRILRGAGYEAEAKKVAIAKQRDRRRYLSMIPRMWNRVLGATIGFGYRPQKALVIGAILVIVGAFVFGWGYRQGLMEPTKTPTPTSFNAAVYSVDTFVPIIDFHQEEFWIPDGRSTRSRFLAVYLWVHVGLGWVLTSLGVLGLTGVVRKD